VWIGARDGMTVPGFVVGYDYDSGLALVKPSLPLPGPAMVLGGSDLLAVGDPVCVAASGGDSQAIEAFVVAKQEFAGRWEYVLDEAIFTSPPHPSWGGAACIGADGRLQGVGSLFVQEGADMSAQPPGPAQHGHPELSRRCAL
jgi:S1-C subfamily serine protease